MSFQLTETQLSSIVAPRGKSSIIANTVKAFNQYAEDFGFTTDLRRAHFIAQIAHESDGFNTTVEYGGSSKRYAPWYGRGLIQTTWEDNYIDLYKWCVNQRLNPPEFFNGSSREEVARFPWAFVCAIWYWDTRKLNKLADQDNIREITRQINGGYNGLEDRITYLNRAKKIFSIKANPVDAKAGTITARKFKVKDVQQALVNKGMKIVVDGVMGQKTIAAVKLFQKLNGLVPDGVIGPKTQAILFAE